MVRTGGMMGMCWCGRVALAGCLALVSCAMPTGGEDGEAVVRQAPDGRRSAIGGERDAHGCLSAAGYSFSVVRGGCVRVFECGVRVVDAGARPGFSSFVVFGTDGERAEVFLPDAPGSRVLSRQGRIWSGGGFSLWLERGEWVLSRPDDGAESGAAGG